ncbi:hypothetical protein ADIWIN_2500 [Winogradskyella psychrotolerans RS-3]|uniref:Uncharacterized protein n=1 Tax=Winogradskyella psychrotolerans RS-3 TaxID=641526 RepID=S7VPZ4_9FLAO|nr:hypothetical protein [Winogradskyella psychrotolerans]EPR72330.1 hypothetical protein ADIWIN_2500 [Winogradskyella psychrotolerans RS-3]
MNNFRNRPKDNYIHEANWEQLYVLTEHWKSDILFYKDDLRFLHHLIDNYFLWLSKRENIDLVQEIEVKLLLVDKQSDALVERLDKHLHHLAELIDDPFVFVADTFRNEHELLEDDLAQFVKDFRNNRKEVFLLTEHIIKRGGLIRQFNSISK